MAIKVRPTLLLILDGWGQAPQGPGNAVSLAETPNLDQLLHSSPKSLLACSGRAVGLPPGYMGNSEVGHMNIGAGRIVYQDMTRIDMAVEDGSLASNPAVAGTLESLKRSGGTLHLMGLLSDAGVHSHMDHLIAILRQADLQGVPCAVHCFMDGRDTEPLSGLGFIRRLCDDLPPNSQIASLVGRYYAMDRDRRWERVKKAWDCMVNGVGPVYADSVTAMETAYAAGETDEFLTPCLILDGRGQKISIDDSDGVFFFNFRADRARELCQCFFDPGFSEFNRQRVPYLAAFATMTRYEADFPMPAAFERQNLARGLGECVSNAGLSQLRLSETEKYAHVTYFFNGGQEEPFPGEDRLLVPSPRDVPTYDLKPRMSVDEVTAKLVEALDSGTYVLIVCNFANMDMVGHTGNVAAAIAACEAVDQCLGRVLAAVKANGWRLLLTADHGNAEELLTADGNPQTAHSKNPVALLLVNDDQGKSLRPEGKLGDIAPTILRLWNMEVPEDMDGRSLYLEDTE